MKKHWEQSSFFPVVFFPTLTSFPFRNFVFFAKIVTFHVRLRPCCAVVNKLSTLFGFVVPFKTRDFNISFDELLSIQSFKGNL